MQDFISNLTEYEAKYLLNNLIDVLYGVELDEKGGLATEFTSLNGDKTKTVYIRNDGPFVPEDLERLSVIIECVNEVIDDAGISKTFLPY